MSFVLLTSLLMAAPARADERAQLHAAIDLLEGKQYLPALDILLPMALDGDAEAQYQIGWMYHYGTGISQNSCVATLWMDKAARQGHKMAQRYMAFAYSGDGVREDHELAYRWLLQAIKSAPDWTVSEHIIGSFTDRLTEQQAADIESTMDDWHAREQPPADIVILPAEATRNTHLFLVYADMGFSECRADFTGTSVEKFGPNIYRPER